MIWNILLFWFCGYPFPHIFVCMFNLMKTFDPPQTNMATKTPGPPSRKTPDHMSKQKMMWQTLPGRNAHTAPIETRRPGWHNTNSKMQRNILFLQNIKLFQHFTYPKQTTYYTLRMHKDPSPERPFQILDTIVYEMIKQKMLWYILHTHCNSLLKLKLWNKCSLWSLRETQDIQCSCTFSYRINADCKCTL